MNEKNVINYDFSSEEVLEMIRDTSMVVSTYNENLLGTVATAYKTSNSLVENVEFWKWMDRNYSGNSGHMFATNDSMNNYIEQCDGKENWFSLQLQGKGYEWDWMTRERHQIKNVFNRFTAGDVSNRPGTDVTRTNMLSRKSQEYQMKAYMSKTNPNVKNTPQDAIVVTNAEKTNYVNKKGYKTEQFQNAKQIEKHTKSRMNDVKNGVASPKYSFQNVAATMGKAGLIGCAIGVGTEALLSYRNWRSGKITDEEYLKEIIRSGGNAGVTSAATAGIMIPISAAIATVGASALISFPISFVIGAAVNKIVAPCFGRGQYRKYLNNATYYVNVECMYAELADRMQQACQEYYEFICNMENIEMEFNEIQNEDIENTKKLFDLYKKI